ncbi:DUF2157 domain-containing protein [Sinorhizobium numidicum]|uniref:DUF2157 domain-containing protein n=1 Tax=Sinorhizobium numidicum TaxID=680248 RepID=A0ABY8CUE0_9HYPH|nr:DUF2157 domain-containing protein [Sinorhizobium numidicum]WEX78863.1 DUF2157 domain-containing protein [Sinorhizobium numidicum]WEX82260.1 DUF2157 domain-containing protein [Sinorhizobium numidicum]
MYRGRLERDLKRWVDLGLLPEPSARAILSEYDSRNSAFNVGRVLLVLAALLVSAAVLLLVAANWELLPRLVRVAGIALLIWTSHFLGAYLLGRGARAPAAALLVLGTMSFGAGIALVGQMYHLSGDAADAMLVWFTGACFSAAVFASPAVTAVAAALAWAFLVTLLMTGGGLVPTTGIHIWLVPILAAIVIVLVRYTEAGRVRHLAYLLCVAWLGALYASTDEIWFAALLFVGGLAGFLLASLPQSPLYRLASEAGSAPSFYSFAVAILGLVALQTELMSLWGEIAVGAALLAVALLGIGLGGARNGAVRYLGYVAFAGETLYLAFATLGSILGTSGFFLVAGVVVALVAWLVIRLEGRLRRAPPEGASS